MRSAWSELSVGASANETDPLERSGHAKRFHAVQASSSSPRTPVRTPTSVRSRFSQNDFGHSRVTVSVTFMS